MRTPVSTAVLVLVLAALACNAPQPTMAPVVCTPPPCAEGEVYYCEGECPGGCGTQCATPTAASVDTPFPVCTPPPCAEGEVYYCEGECPGGCGIQCATPTPGEPMATSSPAMPTHTPIIQCTPPSCTGNEVLYCPGECPGGCGIQCATPTATSQSVPVILSFTADRTTIVEGESVTLSWQATGGTEAFIQWVSREMIWAQAPGPLNPAGGTVAITPTGDGDITLTVGNSAGSVEAHVQLTITCPYPWAPALAGPPPMASGCPRETVFSIAAQQPFENGFMIWIEADRMIYAFYDAREGDSYPTYEGFIDDFEEGDPESDPSIVPPSGLYQPIRGFGLLWRTNQSVRDRLGWATAAETGFQTWMQGYSGAGMHNYYTLLQGIDGTVYHLIASGSVWEVYSP
jgi:hypothetical protein